MIVHDVIADGFNIDHVVVSEKGVFAIETKTFSKPAKGPCVIKYNGEYLEFQNGFQNAEILEQAKANARWLGNKLEELSGKRLQIKPVVLFPGWFIEPVGKTPHSDAWVLNPKVLGSFMNRKNATLRKEDARLVFSCLARHVRS